MSTARRRQAVVKTTTANVRLAAGKQTKVRLSTGQLNANVPTGVYHALVSVTDPDGAKATVNTDKTLTVLATPSRPSRRG